MTAIYVEITATRGSAPRDAGTAMKVTSDTTEGTIGGGALEHEAIQRARKMLENLQTTCTETIPLGPNLGQCCGGTVTLNYTDLPRPTDDTRAMHQHHIYRNPPHPQHLWLWGAGHVGRAIVAAAHPQHFKVTWVDSAKDRFPKTSQPTLPRSPPQTCRCWRRAQLKMRTI